MRRLSSSASSTLFMSIVTVCALCACNRGAEFVTVIPDEDAPPAAERDGEDGDGEGEGEGDRDGGGDGDADGGEGEGEGEPGAGDGDAEPACATSFQTAATTQVGGVLAADTIWTLAGSPYEVTGTVVVPEGVSLTILPGVEVRTAVADGFPLLFLVGGTVEALGRVDAPIVFDGSCFAALFAADEESSGPSYVTVSRAVVQNARSFWPAFGGIASFSLSDSRVENVSEVSYVWYPLADVVIEHNVFVRAAGFSIGHADANVFVRGNRFVSFHPLLVERAPGTFESAFWVENWAAYFGTETVVEQNAFLTTGQIAVQLPAGLQDGALTASNNFWGTTDGSVISGMIFDANDDESSAGVIEAMPVLSDIPLGVPSE